MLQFNKEANLNIPFQFYVIGPLFRLIYGTRFVKEVTLQLPGVRDGQKGKRHAERKRRKSIYKFR